MQLPRRPKAPLCVMMATPRRVLYHYVLFLCYGVNKNTAKCGLIIGMWGQVPLVAVDHVVENWKYKAIRTYIFLDSQVDSTGVNPTPRRASI